MTARELLEELAGDPALLAELRKLIGVRPPAVYTAATLADELGVSARTVRAAIERGELAAARRGRAWIISADAVTEWATPAGFPARRRARPLREVLR